MDLERLKKFYNLASKNPNKNEAAVAALKFFDELKKQEIDLIPHKKGSPMPPTEEQIKEALQSHFNMGYTKGRQDLINELNDKQKRNTAVFYGTASTGNTLRFGNSY